MQIGQWRPREGLKMDDIAWPGDQRSPPLGRPQKWRLRVVTIREEPYVMYSRLDELTNSCPAQALRCRVAALPNQSVATPDF